MLTMHNAHSMTGRQHHLTLSSQLCSCVSCSVRESLTCCSLIEMQNMRKSRRPGFTSCIETQTLLQRQLLQPLAWTWMDMDSRKTA